MRAAKLRKDGIPKRSGLREGDRRVARTLAFKLQVVDEFRRLQQRKEAGQCASPLQAVARRFGVNKSLVSKWAAGEMRIRSAATQANRSRLSLHPGGRCRFPLAEEEVFAAYTLHRAKGQRVTARFLRVAMRRAIHQRYGEEAASSFRASPRWLQAFARRHRISLRRKTNSKHLPVEARVDKIKRWHARFRRRLKRGSNLHSKWGRWLPQDRISIDQVPCNLREGDGRTYADIGSKRVWLVGSKQDDGKRFCSLQIAARCANGPADWPRRGQPRLTIIFRGTGKRILPEERQAWHPDVHVRFQSKAWADEALCAEYARVEVAEITAEARAAGRESVAIFDNLHGHTTQTHLANLARNQCKRHLLPGNTTDELQLVDAGVGHALKTEMAHLHDSWLAQDSNLEMWTGSFPMWRKRVLISQLAAQAWDRLCSHFDFEAAATRLGMRMTADGSGDDLIQVEGVTQYGFTDEDGGAFGDGESDEDDEAEKPKHGPTMEQQRDTSGGRLHEAHFPIVSPGAREQQQRKRKRKNDTSSNTQTALKCPRANDKDPRSEDVDNLAPSSSMRNEHTVASCLPQAVAPTGYTIEATCPPLETRHERDASWASSCSMAGRITCALAGLLEG